MSPTPSSPTKNLRTKSLAQKDNDTRPTYRKSKHRSRDVGQHSLRRPHAPPARRYAESEPKVSLLGFPGGTAKVSGGEFNAVGGNQILLEVNLNGLTPSSQNHLMDSVEYGSGVVEQETENAHSSSSQFASPWVTEDAPTNPPCLSRQLEDSETIVTVYFRSLASKRRGTPLWIPEPNKQLPIEYQRNGLVICDVGVITDRGWFDSLFNISLSPDDPLAINSDDLPRNFSPLEIKPSHISKYSEFKQGSSLSSESIRASFSDDTSSGLVFESSASEGAILTLPDGSNSEDLRNKKKLRDYLSVHGEEMYRCAMIDHGRIIRNGDLRVVTGFDKAASWGMAAFSNVESDDEHSFRLKFRARDQGTPGRMHSWESSNIAEVKAGPDEREVVALRMGDPSQEGVVYENQGVFVRTENITLNPAIWKRLLFESGVGEVETDDDSESMADFEPPSLGSNGDICESSTNHGKNVTWNSSTHVSRCHSSISLNALKGHPSNSINDMLLKLQPSARMAITEDDVWISVLQKDDVILPSVEILWSRITETYNIHVENGVVSLNKIMDEICEAIDNKLEINSLDTTLADDPNDNLSSDTQRPANETSKFPTVLLSSSSSNEPVTQPLREFGSPCDTAPIPRNTTAHPLFMKSDLAQQYSFDISKPLSSTDFNNIPQHMWSQPASSPGMPSMTIICDRLPWTLTITSQSEKGVVTVRDVLEGIHTALRQNVTAAEFRTLSISEQTEVTSAYNARCKYFFKTPRTYAHERSKGLKRVDFLRKHSYFAGIEFLQKEGRWKLFARTDS